ncbi:hypothetical protein V5735_06035 (plasmid) [Haladaptatus sp. SPP-AMP-3]|uniref:DUF7283 family protein n=1 Tax=Haladaptatus sp. SPP-AMP-3 TaxID=3121295 RepID=UPI003C2B26C9
MFDAPLDAWYVWLGVTVVSFAVLGVAIELPTAPPPNAASVADTVDSVAGCTYTATAEHPLSARKIKLGSRRLGLDGKGGTAHATFAYGPVVPVVPGGGRRSDSTSRLNRVLSGSPPSAVFDSPADFRATIREFRDHRPVWRRAHSTLRARCVSWEGVDATLVSG